MRHKEKFEWTGRHRDSVTDSNKTVMPPDGFLCKGTRAFSTVVKLAGTAMINQETIEAIIESFVPQQRSIEEKLQKISEQRKARSGQTGVSIALRLGTAEEVRCTKEAALDRNAHIKNELEAITGKLRSLKCYSPCEHYLQVTTQRYSEFLARADSQGLETVRDIRETRPRNWKTCKRSSSGRFWSSALRLNNNDIDAIQGITDIVTQIFEVPENLTWLDLSFNRLSYITYEITQLNNLKIIYLHGNQFMDFKAVLPHLQTLPKLYSLTLHGNPIEQRRGYRSKVLTFLPRLRSLDFTNVTKCELEKINETGSSRAASSR